MNANTRKTPFFVVFLLLAGVVVSGCATRKTSTSDSTAEGYGVESDKDRETMTSAERFAYDYRSAALARMQEDESVPLSKALLIETAKTAIGTPYVRGGSSTDGFDCSGFVQWAFKHVGVKLPRTAREQSTVGTPVRNFDDMVAGDIVAFKHPRRGYHTGIYVGDGKFIHSPRKRNVVRINSLDDPYFSSTFMGARRLNVSNEGDIEAAEKMLAAYANQPPPKKVASRSSKKDKKSSARASARNSKNDKSKASATKSEKTTKVKTVALKTDKAAKKTSPNKEDKASSSKDKKTSKSTAKKTEKKKS